MNRIVVISIVSGLLFSSCAGTRHYRKKVQDWSTFVETNRDAVGNKLLNLTQSLDKFFGDEREEQEYDKFRLDVTARTQMESSEGLSGSLPISGIFPLPILKRRLALVYGSQSDIEDLEGVNPFDRNKRDVDSGLRLLVDKKNYTYKLNMGFYLAGGATFYVRPGFRYEWLKENSAKRLTQSLIWDNQNGFGESTDFEWDRTVAERTYFRSASSMTYSEVSNGVELSQGFILRYRALKMWAAALEYQAQMSTHPNVQLDSTVMYMRFRSQFLFHWMQQEVSPYMAFRRSDDFKPIPGIKFILKMYFENPHARKRKAAQEQ